MFRLNAPNPFFTRNLLVGKSHLGMGAQGRGGDNQALSEWDLAGLREEGIEITLLNGMVIELALNRPHDARVRFNSH